MATDPDDRPVPPPLSNPFRALTMIAALGIVTTLFVTCRDTAPSPTASDGAARAFPGATLAYYPDSKLVTGMNNLESATTLGRDLDTIQERYQASMEFVQRQVVSEALGLERRAELRPLMDFPDPRRPGYSVVRIRQVITGVPGYAAVPIFGGDIKVSLRTDQGAISSIAARAASATFTDLNPEIDSDQAGRRALQFYRSIVGDPRGRLPVQDSIQSAELVYLDPKRFRLGGDPTLAWRIRVGPIETFVGANAGNLIYAYDTRQSVCNRFTHDCATPNCPVIIQEHVKPAKPVLSSAQQVHDAAFNSHRYFLTRFNRDGYDDVGNGAAGTAPITSHVRVSSLAGAEWDEAQQRFHYGDGWTASDIASHEYVHAVTTFGPGLINASESGSVNEFFSDFFGVMIERFQTGSIDWRLGESAPGFSAARPVRDMANPHNGAFDPSKDFDLASNWGQPDHYTELVTTNDPMCANRFLSDNSCVHFNSGILSKAAVLAVDGGTHRGTTVAAIGADKVEQIMFQAWMGSDIGASSGLKETADAAITACGNLVGRFSITAGDCTNFTQAFVAVGLR
jgi:Zn-dependent metalloprotease